ncbi:CHAT domain-containing tetratricopeptide repeat protein [Sphingobium nicotianae]|uniref:CHAT domain-containing protein n=1 Tax=Sphingobium nicotianae TaxID=2782607 RepID=A0A9X1DAT6_9SPHN|nr:CHAT domain-containing protein [Sphingobium nicotianae]MBT2186534.1 CHAT domain-containing protein [Sphingobium nicotianae]
MKRRTARLTLFALAVAGQAMPLAAQGKAVDRTRLDQLFAQFDSLSPEADPAAYRSTAAASLVEAQRLFPAGHPDVAIGRLNVAQGMAAAGEMDKAMAEVDALLPVLAAAKANHRYRASWRNALNTRAYILNFKGEHDAALAINEQLLTDYEADPARDQKDYATVLSNLAASYLEHGRLDDALKSNAQAIEVALKIDPVPADVAMWNANRVVYLYSAGRTEDAIATAQNALARLTPAMGADHPAMANLYANLGAILFRTNRPHDAMPMIRRAYELIEKTNGGPNQNSATMRVQFAQALMRAGQYEDAVAFLSTATPIIDAQLGAQSDRALNARDSMLIALINTGKGKEAQPIAEDLLKIRDARLPEGHRDRANARDNLAKAAFANGDWATAETAARESVVLRTKMLPADHPDLLLARTMLLRVQDRAGTRPTADLLYEARRLFEALTLNANLARGSAQAERQRPAYGWLAEIFTRRGATEDAFKAQQWAARSSIDDALAIAQSERAAAAEPAFAQIVAQRRQLLAARQGLEARLDANLGKPDPAFDLAGVTGELDANREAIAVLDSGLEEAQRAQLFFIPSSLAEVAAASPRGTATVMITDVGGSWLLTAASGKRVTQYLIGDQPVGTLIARLRGAINAGTAASFDRAGAAQLYVTLFPGRAGAMLRGSQRLAVIANGALGALPFGLLVPEVRGKDYLIDRLVVNRLVRAPRAGRSGVAARAVGETLIALGGVEGRKAGALMAMRSAGTARAIDALPELPDARRELTALAEAIGAGSSHLLVGEQATEAQLRATSIPQGAVLAFATHGLVSGELDGLDEPALLLTPDGRDDGLLKPSEIGGLNLPARLVILSACNTASAADEDRPQLSGLVQGFFLAGADRVMASHWPVRDDIARRLSVGTVKGMRAGADPARALHNAILTVRSGKDGEAGANHPALWAPFELFSR